MSKIFQYDVLLFILYHLKYREEKVYYQNEKYYKDLQSSVIFFFKRVFFFLLFHTSLIISYLIRVLFDQNQILIVMQIPFLVFYVFCMVKFIPKTFQKLKIDVDGDLFYGMSV